MPANPALADELSSPNRSPSKNRNWIISSADIHEHSSIDRTFTKKFERVF
jgi:hypothetical protein